VLQLVDVGGQQGHLDFGGARVAFTAAVFADDLRLLFVAKCHVLSPRNMLEGIKSLCSQTDHAYLESAGTPLRADGTAREKGVAYDSTEAAHATGQPALLG